MSCPCPEPLYRDKPMGELKQTTPWNHKISSFLDPQLPATKQWSIFQQMKNSDLVWWPIPLFQQSGSQAERSLDTIPSHTPTWDCQRERGVSDRRGRGRMIYNFVSSSVFFIVEKVRSLLIFITLLMCYNL